MGVKKNNDVLIGFLLIFPIYLIALFILGLLKINFLEDSILLPILVYLPIIVGIALSYNINDKKMNKFISILIIVFIIIGCYFYYDTYFVDHDGWRGLNSFLYWIIYTVICRLLSCIFYWRIFGLKKAIILLLLYLLIVVPSFILLWQ